MKMEDTKEPKLKKFKYLGSTVQESSSCEREVKKSAGRMERMDKSIGSNLRQEVTTTGDYQIYDRRNIFKFSERRYGGNWCEGDGR